MKCNHCGKDINEDARFCCYCGTPLQTLQDEVTATVDGEDTNPQSTAESSQSKTNETKKCSKPITLIGIVFSTIAFLSGLVIFSIMLAKKLVAVGADTLIFISAFVGLACGIVNLCKGFSDKKQKILSLGAIALSGFTVFYGFLTYCVLLG